MKTPRRFSYVLGLLLFFGVGRLWALPSGTQTILTPTFTDNGATLSSTDFNVSGSANLDIAPAGNGQGAYLVSTSTTQETMTVAANNSTVTSFELTGLVFDEFQNTDAFIITVIGTKVDNTTVSSNTITGTSGADTYAINLANFSGVQIKSFTIQVTAPSTQVDDFSLVSFTVANAQAPDITPPTISGVTSSTANGSYKAGDAISIQVNFSENVTVTGTPQLTLETGTTDRVVNYASGSGSSSLTFTYTVQAGDTSADLDYLSTSALALNSGTIKDAAGNNATLTLASPGAANSLGANKALVIDTTAPTISGVTSSTANGSYKVGDAISIQVNFSENVTVTGTPQLTLETGTTDQVVNYASGSGTSTLTFTYTVQAGDTSADLDYLSTSALALNSGTIKDTAGNNATLTLASPGAANSLGANKALVIDTTAPTVSGVTSSTANGSYKAGDAISIQVNFSENVTVTGTPQLTLETGTTDRVVNYASGSGSSSLTFTYTVQAGDTSADLDYLSTSALALNSGTIKDTAGNNATLTLASPGAANSLGANKALVIDTTAPVITSTLTASGTYGSAISTYTITASGSPASFGASGLPSGLSVNTGNGQITGTPTVSGTINATISATDTAGNQGTATLVFTIATKTLTISGVSVSAKVYDGTTTGTLTGTASLVGVLGGDTVNLSTGSATATFADKNVGTGKAITVAGYSISGTSSANYTLTQPTGLTADITAKALTVSGLSATAKTYDGTTTASLSGTAALQSTEAAGAGTTSDGKPYSVDSVSLSGTAAGTFADKNVGTAKAVTVTGITLTGTGSTNYTVTQPTGLTANITAATLTVTADAKSRLYGVANPTFTATITGYVNSETSAVLTGLPSVTTTATISSLPGSYTITAALGTLAANNGNYTFSFVNGTLTVSALAYSDWKGSHFTSGEQADSNISGPDADPDHDGIKNLLEYAFGLDPKTASVISLPTASLVTVSTDRYLAISYIRSKTSSDLTYSVEASGDLASWSSATPIETGAVDNGATETVTTRDTVAVVAGVRRFMRVSVSIASPSASAQTTPVGFVSRSAPASTDVRVSEPLARPSVYVDTVASVSGNVLTVTGTPGWTTDQFVKNLPGQPNTYYVQFKSGSAAGHYYTVTATASGSLTVDWNGETVSVVAGDQFELIPYWTLGTGFPASDAGISFTTSTSSFLRSTELMVYDLSAVGINPPVAATYYFLSGAWRQVGQSVSTSFDDTVLPPDSYILLRNQTPATTLTTVGNVVIGSLAALVTAQGGTTKQDNLIALRFAGTVTLAQSNLVGSGVFQSSPSAFLRKDELLVYNDTSTGTNKPVSATYYYYNGAWRKVGSPVTTDFGSDQVFAPGTGVVLRKAGTGGSAQDSFWIYTVSGL